MSMSPTASEVVGDVDDAYPQLLAAVRARFAHVTSSGEKLFTTRATGLFEAFLGGLPAPKRPIFTCNACRRFVERHGGLVTIAADGVASAALWDPAAVPAPYHASVAAMARLVAAAPIDGVFLSSDKVWGQPITTCAKPPGAWHHLAVTPAAALVFTPTIHAAAQVMAAKLEEYAMLCRGLGEFSLETVAQAHALLTTGNLFRSEKCVGVAAWLLALHRARRAARRAEQRDNLTWRAVASAPAGYCHVRSGMIGSLLEDIVAGLPFADIKARFDAKMHPLQYLRPQAAPSEGNIAQAEAVIATLATAGALARRFARLADVQALWTPAPARELAAKAGVFAHLARKVASAPRAIAQPAVTITWEKFARTVLTEATRIELHVPAEKRSYGAFVTAADPDAPPILQWDRAERRNPVSCYVYVDGSAPETWNLPAGGYHPLTAIALQPWMWEGADAYPHQSRGALLILEGARDLRYTTGAGFFPSNLKSDYHGIRATLEAYAKSAVVAGATEATACGLFLHKNTATWNYLVRVTTGSGVQTYNLDRWD
ncbi:MAG: hypothetical protein K8W52_04890 [Deltaproteobacteria bacterium]|nr:hypothetical protein [Deltaproteobacteria bacterium]